jgi:hypothetical protein
VQFSHQVCRFFCQFCVSSWDDAFVVLAGKLRKLWDSLSELHSFLCERQLERTVLRPRLLPAKIAQFTQFFLQVWRHTVKPLSLTERFYCTFCKVHVYVQNVWRVLQAVTPASRRGRGRWRGGGGKQSNGCGRCQKEVWTSAASQCVLYDTETAHPRSAPAFPVCNVPEGGGLAF